MNKDVLNPCILCGKQRIEVKTYKEKVGEFFVTRTLTVCPDENCQKKVESMLAKEKQKRQVVKEESDKREVERKQRAQISRKKD
jgi:hypothetical protein